MKQATFASAAWSAKGKTTRRERFLAEMNAVIPWARLVALVEPHYPRAGNGRRPMPREQMLRVYFMQREQELHQLRSRQYLCGKAGNQPVLGEQLLLAEAVPQLGVRDLRRVAGGHEQVLGRQAVSSPQVPGQLVGDQGAHAVPEQRERPIETGVQRLRQGLHQRLHRRERRLHHPVLAPGELHAADLDLGRKAARPGPVHGRPAASAPGSGWRPDRPALAKNAARPASSPEAGSCAPSRSYPSSGARRPPRALSGAKWSRCPARRRRSARRRRRS